MATTSNVAEKYKVSCYNIVLYRENRYGLERNTMKNKRIFLGMAVILIGSFVAGCQSETKMEKENSEELIFYINAPQPAEQERIMKKANKIINEEIGATLKLVMVDPKMYAEKMNLLTTSEEAWDICFVSNDGGNQFYKNAQKGVYADLTELLPKLAPETYKRIPENLWKSVTIGNRIFASVNYQQWGAASRNGFRFREDLAEEVQFDWKSLKGKPTLEVLEETGNFIGKVLERHPEMIGWETTSTKSFFADLPLYWDMEEIGEVNSPGWIRYSDPYTVINQFETEEFKQYCDIMREWHEKGYVRKDGATVQDSSIDRKKAKIIAEYTTGWPDTLEYPDNMDLRKMSMCTKDAAPAVGVSNTRTILTAGAGIKAAIAVNAKSKHTEKAVELIELLNTNDELYLLLTNGEEGIDYRYDEKGNVQKIDGKYDLNYNEWQIGQSYSPKFTRVLYDKNENGQNQKESQKIVFDADQKAEISPLMGFVFDPSKVQVEIANCSIVIDEMIPVLSNGTVEPEQLLPEFLNKLKTAGVDRIIEEKQVQLDKFYELNE